MDHTVGIILGFAGLFITIISSAVGVAVTISSRLARQDAELSHIARRLELLEARPHAARRRAK